VPVAAGTLPLMTDPPQAQGRQKGFFAAAEGMPPWVPKLLAQVTAIVVLLWAAYHVARALKGFLILLLISLFLSIALEPGVAYLSTKRGWRRGAATAAMFSATLLLLFLSVSLMVPLIIDQTQKLIDRVPGYIDQIAEFLARFDIEVSTESLIDSITRIDASAAGLAGGLGGTLLGLGSAVVGTIFQFLTIGLFTFYMTADAPRVRRVILRSLPQHRQRRLLHIQEIAIEKTGGYIYSRALLAIVGAFVTWIALRIIGVPFAEPLALWVGVLSQFVPVVGTYLGGVLPVLIALLESPAKALWVAVFIVLYQQFENYVVGPRVTEHTMSLHPAVAFGSAIVGATLMGAAGALMALPVAATVQAWVSTYTERYDVVSGRHPGEEPPTLPAA
jgi:predicted PurR-regulated permease PerM